MFKKNENLSANQEIVLREEDEGAFLFEPDSGRLCHLNEVGTNIWKRCRNPIAPEQIIREISSEYPETPQEQISKDCLLFLKDLKELGFLLSGAEK